MFPTELKKSKIFYQLINNSFFITSRPTLIFFKIAKPKVSFIFCDDSLLILHKRKTEIKELSINVLHLYAIHS